MTKNNTLNEALQEPSVCEILRTLRYRTEGCSREEIGRLTGISNEEINKILDALMAQLIVIANNNQRFCISLENKHGLATIDQTILKHELLFVKERAERINYNACTKLMALDQLAEHIMIARRDIRS